MQTANANVFVIRERDTSVKGLHAVQRKPRRLARKRNLLIFAVAYGIVLALVLKLLF